MILYFCEKARFSRYSPEAGVVLVSKNYSTRACELRITTSETSSGLIWPKLTILCTQRMPRDYVHSRRSRFFTRPREGRYNLFATQEMHALKSRCCTLQASPPMVPLFSVTMSMKKTLLYRRCHTVVTGSFVRRSLLTTLAVS